MEKILLLFNLLTTRYTGQTVISEQFRTNIFLLRTIHVVNDSVKNKGYKQINSFHVAITTDRKAHSTKTRRAPEPPFKTPGRTKSRSRYEVDKYEPHEDNPNEEYGNFSVVFRKINNSSNPENVGKEASPNVKVPSSKTKRAPMPLLSNLKRSDSTLSYGAKPVSIKTKRSNRRQ
ncbi:uncharacterized protein LOC127718652 [Mytilus californianus]|uniref:uncharacterized protein LOC127718652 n=1 Tax=Mytilus californianus TaxID=6549 RepID=UPI0022467680|nr:uncharacterized protein LOC127718652 [Mytilus californianus]